MGIKNATKRDKTGGQNISACHIIQNWGRGGWDETNTDYDTEVFCWTFVTFKLEYILDILLFFAAPVAKWNRNYGKTNYRSNLDICYFQMKIYFRHINFSCKVSFPMAKRIINYGK